MEYEKTIVYFTIFDLFSTIVEIRNVYCPIGCPSFDINNNDVAFNHTYALSNNPTTKFADWVAYEVNVLNFGVSAFIFCITEQKLLVTILHY
jgi:endonuclease G